MFIVILVAVLGLIHVYLWKRLIKDTTRPGVTRWVLTGTVMALTAVLFAALILPRVIGTREAGWYAWPGYLWFGVAAYLFLLLLVLEPVRLVMRSWVGRAPPSAVASGSTATVTVQACSDEERAVQLALTRRLFLARTGAAAAGVASVSLVAVGAANALGPPEMLHVPVRLRHLDPAFNGFRIAVVSDIHLGPLTGRAHTERIVRMINETAPDLVAIVGDLVDGTVEELGPVAEPLRDLHSKEGTFFVTGNHEYIVDDTASWLRELERLGIHLLRNEGTAIRRAPGRSTWRVSTTSPERRTRIRPISTARCVVETPGGRQSCSRINR